MAPRPREGLVRGEVLEVRETEGDTEGVEDRVELVEPRDTVI